MDELSTRKAMETKHLFGGYVLLLVAAAAIVVTYGGSAYSEALRYERDAILAGQVWRLLTAPLVHLTWSHALMNIGALIIIWGLFGQVFSSRAWVYITLGCALGISAGLLVLNPGISWYVGLSGILHGYFASGAIAERQTYKRTSMVMLLLVCGKLLWEQIFGPLPGSAEAAGGKVIVDTHLYGAICGLVPGWLLSRDRDKRAKIKHH
jgi:rhomboid family GlyGly-CTERM serine protease